MARQPIAARPSNSLAPGIAALAVHEGCTTTRYKGVVVWRMSASHPPTPTLYTASLILVGSGRKQATLGKESFVYDADHLLVVTSPLPMLCRTVATAVQPVLTVVIEIELTLLRELLHDLEALPSTSAEPVDHAVFSVELTRDIEDAGARLLSHLSDARRTHALARQTIRELLFLVLEQPEGHSLRASTSGASGQFARVLRHMNAHFAERVTVGELADMARTSVPTFYQRFKAMTGTSPLQYMKSLRLTRARQMLGAGGMVKAVAQAVGYDSESHFSREYRRFFGAPPSTSSRVSPRHRE